MEIVEINNANFIINKEAKKKLINILRRKGTILTDVYAFNDIKTYRCLASQFEEILGSTVIFTIKLAFKKQK